MTPFYFQNKNTVAGTAVMGWLENTLIFQIFITIIFSLYHG